MATNLNLSSLGYAILWFFLKKSPVNLLEENKKSLDYDIEPIHAFGLRAIDSRNNLFFLNDEEIVYITGALLVKMNIIDFTQVIFGGTSKESKMSHDNDIVDLEIYYGNPQMIATTQNGHKPKIIIWDPQDNKKILHKFELPKSAK